MNLVLTGGTGFLGSHLVREFLANTGYRVFLLKRTTSSLRRIDDLLSSPRLRLIDIDVTDIETVFRENAIDVVLHAATEYGRGVDTTGKVLDANLILPIRLLESAIKHRTRSFINVDSYFNKENLSYAYLLNYSLSKKSLLIWLRKYSHSIQVSNVCLEHIYGEHDGSSKFSETMIRKIAIEQVPFVDLTPGHQKRDFVYVKDAVKAFTAIVEDSVNQRFRFRSYDLGSGRATTIMEFVNTIKVLSKSPTELRFGAIPYREDEIMYSCADIIDLENIGWHPGYSLREGIAEVMGAYRP